MCKTAFCIALLFSTLLIVVPGEWGRSQNADKPFGFSLDSDLEMLQAGQCISTVEARRLESQLVSNPEDIKARALLGAYYFRNAIRRQRLENALWLTEHHPDSELLRSSAFSISAEESPVNDMASYERAKARRLALSHDDQQSPEVLWNASSFISQFDPSR